MNTGFVRLLFPTLVLIVPAVAGEPASEPVTPLEGPEARISYSLGHQIGGDLLEQGATIETDALRSGILDGLAGADPALDPERMSRLLADLKRALLASKQADKRRDGERHKEAGARFLADNAAREEVVTLPSGLQYEVLRAGTGPSPGIEDRVAVHYRGHTLDGHQFYDSYAKGAPAVYPVGGIVPGMTEALQRMRVGAKWKLFLSPDLAYGARGPLAHHAVIFEVELIAIEEGE